MYWLCHQRNDLDLPGGTEATFDLVSHFRITDVFASCVEGHMYWLGHQMNYLDLH